MQADVVRRTLPMANHCLPFTPPHTHHIDRCHRTGWLKLDLRDHCQKRRLKRCAYVWVLITRRSLISEGAGTKLDGMETVIDDRKPPSSKNTRLEDEVHITERMFQRLNIIKTIFIITAEMTTGKHITKAWSLCLLINCINSLTVSWYNVVCTSGDYRHFGMIQREIED